VAAAVPAEEVRRALMLAGELPAVAAAVLGEGRPGLARFHLELTYELRRIRQLFPYCWQEGRAPRIGFEDQAIDRRPQRREQLLFRSDVESFRKREQRQMQVHVRPFRCGERREAVVAERGGPGVSPHVFREWPRRVQRSAAAAQLLTATQSHERRAPYSEPGQQQRRREGHHLARYKMRRQRDEVQVEQRADQQPEQHDN